ncbi:hypothetical protein [Spirillospora sp. CA-128828]|uniref:hypothetical protein n=1 Tax=Spirillospora sp. CA-128828 TaxID=3240033 RepID=UPI003D941F74
MTQTGSLTGTDDEIKDALRDEFPAWSIIRSDRGRWWANRGPLVSETLSEQACVDADSAEELRDKIREVESQ